MRLAPWIGVLLLAPPPHAQRTAPDAAAPVFTEFRVFDGPEEVTATTRLRVTAAGRHAAPPIEVRTAISLAPAMYDVQAIRTSPGGLVSVKSVERLAVMHYPDEQGRHVEVVNFQPGFGALQLRSMRGRLDPKAVSLFPAGVRTTPAGAAIAGDDYVLFVVQAGKYDVRVQHADHRGAADTYWILALDVPADRTRLKLVEAP